MFTKFASFAAAAALTTLVAASFAAPAHAYRAQQGISINGISINGMLVNGMLVNGFLVNGMLVNGMRSNGVEQAVSAFTIDGIELPATAR